MMVDALIDKLGLSPLPMEGGYYRETYRCDESIPASGVHPRYERSKSHCTAIYFLVTPDSFSALHRVKSDEIFHFYAGDPVEMLTIRPDGACSLTTIGPDVMAGRIPQFVVPRGVWQGCRLVDGGEYALLGCTVSPAFDFEDYEHGLRESLVREYPSCAELICRFTR